MQYIEPRGRPFQGDIKMFWFNPKPKKPMEEIHVPSVHFLGEQNGSPETELKNHLIDFFKRTQSPLTAYLARVLYENRFTPAVALCLRTQLTPSNNLIERVGKIFTSMFGSHEHMDIIFINDDQELELKKVCDPFYTECSQTDSYQKHNVN